MADSHDPVTLERAAGILRGGGLVVVPTDTVYGLAVALDNESAVERIFSVKGRSPAKGLIAMIADPEDLSPLIRRTRNPVKKLIKEFWPGPLTLILEASENVPTKASVNGKIGIRLPRHELLRDLIRLTGRPLATTSANLSGSGSAAEAGRCRDEIGDLVDLIIDDGPCALGIESTVADVTDKRPKVIREAAISKARLMEVWWAK